MRKNDVKRKIDFSYAVDTLTIRLHSLLSTNGRFWQEASEDPENASYNQKAFDANKRAIQSIEDAIAALKRSTEET